MVIRVDPNLWAFVDNTVDELLGRLNRRLEDNPDGVYFNDLWRDIRRHFMLDAIAIRAENLIGRKANKSR
jgi:hypothetical protein